MLEAPSGQRMRTGPGSAVRERRSDARRNITAILDAALDCLSRDPQANIVDIAKSAGVGRVTLYGHFATRGQLVEAAFVHALRQAEATLDALDLSGDPRQALTKLATTSWQIMDRYRGALAAAQRELPLGRIRSHVDGPMERLAALIGRGQQVGVFRSDLPTEWLVAMFYTVMHGAVSEIAAGRLLAEDAARVINATLVAAYAPPGSKVPS
ncbi:MAG TPA: TetR/AcrR family transcriptional regulator [Streptosporangiaceae bacterium]|nr:TetR/AcrR family transcriptional regulator [Streptosporangiaceae bacterium]